MIRNKFGALPAMSSLLTLCCIAIPLRAQESGPSPAPSTETFSAYELRLGKTASPEECAAHRHAVWIETAYGKECIRYYVSDGLENVANMPREAVLFFHGDRLSGSKPLGPYDKSSPASLTTEMQANYRKYGAPFIFVARPGVYGSSGDHSQRRRPKEFHSLNAAVDAIKQHYGLDKIVIAGQSGGSTVGGALLTLGRKDIACAVLGSGSYDILELAEIKRAKLGFRSRPGCDVTNYCDPYNVIDHVSGIVSDPERLIAIVGDPRDNNTVFPLQQKFAEALAAAGHQVKLIQADGKGPDQHSLSHITYRFAGECAAGLASGKLPRSMAFSTVRPSPTHAYVVPPASDFARIEDVAAVPVSGGGKPRYAHYLTLLKPKAFVVTEKGGWFFTSGDEEAMQRALDLCPAAMQCWLYAVDDQVVWKGREDERIATVRRADRDESTRTRTLDAHFRPQPH